MNIAIVTGASSGIGEEILRGLVRERGAFGSLPFGQIWAIARSSDRLELLRNELGTELIRVFALDLTDPSSINALSEALKKENPIVGMLVNCAGIGRVGEFSSQTPGDQRAMVSLNCSVPAEMASLCLPYMIRAGRESDFRNGPRILNIASSAAFMPQPGFATYAATKAFLVNFSRAVNAELRPRNITSTTVCPGPVSTDFLAHATGKPSASFSGIKSLFVARPDKLAAASIRASRKGRAVLIYGLSQKVFHVLTKFLPARLMMFLASSLTESEPSASSVDPAPVSSSDKKISPVSMTIVFPVSGGDTSAKPALKNDSTEVSPAIPTPSTSPEALAILREYPGRSTI